MSLSLAEAVARIDAIFAKYTAITNAPSLVGDEWRAGKVYEAWVLSVVLERFERIEGFAITLVGGTKIHLKASPGPINEDYPYFRLTRPGSPSYAVWTDVEFATLSYASTSQSGTPGQAHKHELDIVVVPLGVTGYPAHNEIIVGVECKNTGFTKGMARAALGVRRELSYLHRPISTPFTHWPRQWVTANPPSILLVFSTDPGVAVYDEAGQVFGVDFLHEPID